MSMLGKPEEEPAGSLRMNSSSKRFEPAGCVGAGSCFHFKLYNYLQENIN